MFCRRIQPQTLLPKQLFTISSDRPKQLKLCPKLNIQIVGPYNNGCPYFRYFQKASPVKKTIRSFLLQILQDIYGEPAFSKPWNHLIISIRKCSQRHIKGVVDRCFRMGSVPIRNIPVNKPLEARLHYLLSHYFRRLIFRNN